MEKDLEYILSIILKRNPWEPQVLYLEFEIN